MYIQFIIHSRQKENSLISKDKNQPSHELCCLKPTTIIIKVKLWPNKNFKKIVKQNSYYLQSEKEWLSRQKLSGSDPEKWITSQDESINYSDHYQRKWWFSRIVLWKRIFPWVLWEWKHKSSVTLGNVQWTFTQVVLSLCRTFPQVTEHFMLSFWEHPGKCLWLFKYKAMTTVSQ